MAWTSNDIPDLTGRSAVVTGGNGGLGFETVRQLAGKGARVVIAARNQTKSENAARAIREDFPNAEVVHHRLDLASKQSIRSFAKVITDLGPLNILVNNAGILATAQSETEDGFELQYGTNHLGHFYLTRLLMPLLMHAGDATVVTTTSLARVMVRRNDFADPHTKERYRPWYSYELSKEANFVFAMELGRRLHAAGTNVTSHAADPGLARTDIQATAPAPHRWLTRRLSGVVVNVIGHDASSGASPQVRAATDPSLDESSLIRPKFLTSGPPVVASVRQGRDANGRAAHLWTSSESDLSTRFDVDELAAAVD